MNVTLIFKIYKLLRFIEKKVCRNLTNVTSIFSKALTVMLNVAIFLLLFFYSALLASVPLPQSVTVGDYEYKDLNNVIVGSGGIFPGGSLFGWSDILFTTARAFDSMGCMINGTQFVANEPIDLLAGNR